MSKEESSSANTKLSSLSPAYVKIKWLTMYGGVACQNSLNSMGSSNSSGVYNEPATKSPGSFRRSGEPFEMLALHVNSLYALEVKKTIMVMFYLYFSSAER